MVDKHHTHLSVSVTIIVLNGISERIPLRPLPLPTSEDIPSPAETKQGNESADKGFSPIEDVGDFVLCWGS